MSIIDKIESITVSRNTIRTKMVSAGQATRTDKLATLASNLSITNTSDATATAADIAEGKTAYVEGTKITGTSTKDADTSDATATAGDILSGATAYVNGSKLVGTIQSKDAHTYTPGTTAQTIASGQYLAGTQTIQGSSALTAANIKQGTSIFGVTGTFTSDATATAADIAEGKTAYVDGEKITGTNTNDADTSIVTSGQEDLQEGVTELNNNSLYFQSSYPKGRIPYNFYHGLLVVYNNKIHLLGGNVEHYTWDDISYQELSNLPLLTTSSMSNAVVYNNKIHLLGNVSSHWEWDGSTWTRLSNMPYRGEDSSAVVFGGAIHLLGGDYESADKTKHYKWDGSSWTSVSTLPYNFYDGSRAVVYNNEIHILGGLYSPNKHYKWNGTTWSEVSTLPFKFSKTILLVYNNELHALYSNYDSANKSKHYKWNGTTWTEVSTLPTGFDGTGIVYNNKIHIMGGGTASSDNKCHYVWNNSTSKWESLSDIQYLKGYVGKNGVAVRFL